MASALPTRRHQISETVGPFIVSVGFDPRDGKPCEVFVTKRAKSGTDLDGHLYDLGVAASKIMQGEHG